MAKFKDGDIVQLKSGGPRMTVYEANSKYTTINCIWFDNDKKKCQGYFTEETLAGCYSPWETPTP